MTGEMHLLPMVTRAEAWVLVVMVLAAVGILGSIMKRLFEEGL